MNKVYLKDIAKIQIGISAPKQFDNIDENSVPFIRAGLLENLCNNKEKFLEFLNKNKYKTVPKNTVIFAKSGMSALKDRVYTTKFESVIVGHLAGIICDEKKLIPKYLEYYLKNNKPSKLIQNNAYPSIRTEDIENIKMNVPTIEKQHEIVNKLDKIASIISIRKTSIEKCGELIKSQFVEMFKDEKKYSKEYLKDNIIEMFIGPFGSALKNECFVDECDSFCVVYEQKHAINKFVGDFRFVDKIKHDELKRFEILPNDIIVSCRGTIGETFVIPNDAPLGIMHPSIMKIRLDLNKYNPIFFNELIKQYLIDNINMTKGGTIKMGIKATDLGNTKFIRPKIEEQIKFLNIKNQIDKQKFEFEKSLKKLEELQSSLMQEYFG